MGWGQEKVRRERERESERPRARFKFGEKTLIASQPLAHEKIFARILSKLNIVSFLVVLERGRSARSLGAGGG